MYQFSDHNLRIQVKKGLSRELNWIERRTSVHVFWYYILNQRIVEKHLKRRVNNQGDK